MSIILHIACGLEWEQATEDAGYAPASLASEGFIHCSTPLQTEATANTFFRGRSDLVLLVIDEARLQPELRYETPALSSDPRSAQLFPHVYGALNLDAVLGVHAWVPEHDGCFRLPPDVRTDDARAVGAV